MKNKIPKTIHYCWFGKNPKSKLMKKCINSWKRICPEYEIIEWNEDNFDINMNKYVAEAYKSKKWAFVSDYARLYVIYNYGGIYFDTDVELIKKIDPLLDNEAFFCSEEKGLIATGLGFGAIKGNKLVKDMLDIYEDIGFINDDGSFDLTPCPVRNTKAIESIYKQIEDYDKLEKIDGAMFFPKEYFCPFDVVTGKLNITDKSYAIHWYNASWIKNRKFNKIKTFISRRLKRIIGIERFNKIKKVLKK